MNAVKSEAQSSSAIVTPQMQTVLDYLKEHNTISDEEMMSLLNIKKTRLFELTTQMVGAGLINVEGRGASKKITL